MTPCKCGNTRLAVSVHSIEETNYTIHTRNICTASGNPRDPENDACVLTEKGWATLEETMKRPGRRIPKLAELFARKG